MKLSAACLLLAGGLAVAKALGQGPSDLQAGQQISTIYPAVLAYQYAALPVTAVIFVAWVFLAVVWLKRVRQPQGRATRFAAVAVTSLSLLWAGVSALPSVFVGYDHLQSVTAGANDYRLGVRTAIDGDYFFVVSQCPHGQLRCVAYGVAVVSVEEHDHLSQARLTIDNTTQAVTIQTASRSIPFRIPSP